MSIIVSLADTFHDMCSLCLFHCVNGNTFESKRYKCVIETDMSSVKHSLLLCQSRGLWKRPVPLGADTGDTCGAQQLCASNTDPHCQDTDPWASANDNCTNSKAFPEVCWSLSGAVVATGARLGLICWRSSTAPSLFKTERLVTSSEYWAALTKVPLVLSLWTEQLNSIYDCFMSLWKCSLISALLHLNREKWPEWAGGEERNQTAAQQKGRLPLSILQCP